MVKITALVATMALALTGCYAEGYTVAPGKAGKARFATMRECAKEATSTPRPGRPKYESYMCEKKLLGFTSEHQEYVRGEPIVCAEPSSDGA
ncbi:hypothetical protein PAGU2595_028600 [Lysobacter xanthus]